MTLEQLIADYTKQRDALYEQAERQMASSNFSRGQALALDMIIDDLIRLNQVAALPDPKPTGEAGSP